MSVVLAQFSCSCLYCKRERLQQGMVYCLYELALWSVSITSGDAVIFLLIDIQNNRIRLFYVFTTNKDVITKKTSLPVAHALLFFFVLHTASLLYALLHL